MKTDTRKRLIESASQLFWEKGYASTGIAEILKKADVRSGSLYYFFPTKEDLLLSVLDWYRENLDRMVLNPVFSRISDPIERIFGILAGYRRQLLATDFQHGCPVGSLALELSNALPQARRRFAENFDGWRQAVTQCLRDASGRLPNGTPMDGLALFILTTMEGGIMLARTYRTIESYDTAVTHLREYLDSLLRQGTQGSHPAPSSSPENHER